MEAEKTLTNEEIIRELLDLLKKNRQMMYLRYAPMWMVWKKRLCL